MAVVAFDLVSDLAFGRVLSSSVSSAPPSRLGSDSFLDLHRLRGSSDGGVSVFMYLFFGFSGACLKISLSSSRLASSVAEVKI